jgi:hypothetical protein
MNLLSATPAEPQNAFDNKRASIVRNRTVSKAKTADSTILKLVLKRRPFDVMVSGEKSYEFRTASGYWRKRLLHPDGTGKKFLAVVFTNGYGPTRPKFCAVHVSTSVCSSYDHIYSNGLHVQFRDAEHIVLKLGAMLEQPESL